MKYYVRKIEPEGLVYKIDDNPQRPGEHLLYFHCAYDDHWSPLFRPYLMGDEFKEISGQEAGERLFLRLI